MKAAWTFTALHVAALIAGLFGILVAIPHPELWAGRPAAAAVYAVAVNKTGGVSIALGALAMLAYGCAALGARRTLTFFGAAVAISAAAELTGTATGWPFGGYEYADFLGPKLLGRVPAAVPLSWFTMGFAAYVLAEALTAERRARGGTVGAVLLSAWLLTAWDLVLDPSMAAPQLQYLHFWRWHENGPYFGMPLRNLAGWFATGLAFIAAGRALGGAPRGRPPLVALPFTVYAANVAWSMVLSAAAGMWPTAVVAIALALVPASTALRRAPRPATAG